MKRVLVDTSIWIEFFAKSPKVSQNVLDRLSDRILEQQVVLIQPVRAELLSGHVSKALKGEIERCFDAIEYVDLDWSRRENWEDIIAFASSARKIGLAIPGLIDRMILLSALLSNASLCTADKALVKLAKKIGVDVWPA